MNYPFPRSGGITEDPCGPPNFLVVSSLQHNLEDDPACRFVFSPETNFDGILVLDSYGAESVETIVRETNSYVLPMANLSGAALPFADFQSDVRTSETISLAIEELSHIARRIQTLPDGVRASAIPETILLARAYSRKRVIEPVYDPSVRDCVIYPVAGLVDEPGRRAERMTNAGYFTRMFFDRLHACPDCGSSRLNAREECVACRSADLSDQALIHHLQCGHQSLEADFRQQGLLVCPGCNTELHIEGVEYEKPGTVNTCRSCGHVSSQASVGFVCIDCKSRHDSEAIATRDFYKYELTRKGERALITNEPWVTREKSTIGSSPQEAVIHQALRLHSRYGRPLAILRVTFGIDNREYISDRLPSDAQASNQLAAILHSETRETDVIVEAENGFFVYMPETPDDGVNSSSTRLRDRINATLPAGFDVNIKAMRPEDL